MSVSSPSEWPFALSTARHLTDLRRQEVLHRGELSSSLGACVRPPYNNENRWPIDTAKTRELKGTLGCVFLCRSQSFECLLF